MSKRAVLYARVSGDDRSREGRNLAGQLDMCREYALEHGYIVAAELAEDDRGASGAAFELPQLSRVLEMAREGEFDVLVVREIDRLSRSLAKQLIVEQELQRAGVTIEYVLAEYENTPEGRLNKHIKAVIAEYEREKINERVVRGRRLKAKSGNVMAHGRPPYGYRLAEVDGKEMLVIHEPEARIVRLMFTWYVVGDDTDPPLSLAALADRLTDMGIPTQGDNNDRFVKRNGHGVWNRTCIRNMLKRETYAGVFHYGKINKNRHGRTVVNPPETWIPVEVPAIIPHAMWKAAQERLKENKRNARRNTKRQYLLRCRVICGTCRSKMYAKTVVPQDTPYSYYLCGASSGRLDYARECDQHRGFRSDQVDAVVWEWVKGFLTDPAQLMEGLETQQQEREQMVSPWRERLVVLDGLLADNRQQLAKLLDLYLAGGFPQEMLTERKARLEGTIAALEREREGLTAQIEAQTLTAEQIKTIRDFAMNIGEGLELAEADFQTKRRLIELLNVWGTLRVENGELVVYAQCMIGESVFAHVYYSDRASTLTKPSRSGINSAKFDLGGEYETRIQPVARCVGSGLGGSARLPAGMAGVGRAPGPRPPRPPRLQPAAESRTLGEAAGAPGAPTPQGLPARAAAATGAVARRVIDRRAGRTGGIAAARPEPPAVSPACWAAPDGQGRALRSGGSDAL